MKKTLKKLSENNDLVSRFRSIDWFSFFGFLPDPDPVLQKMGEDIRVYKSLMTDAHLSAVYQSRVGATVAREWKLEYPKEYAPSRIEKKALKSFAEILSGLNMHGVISEMLSASLYGMAPAELSWGNNNGLWIPTKIEGKPPEWFVFGIENDLRFLSKDNIVEGEELPEKYKFLIPRNSPTYENPYGDRILAKCFWPVTFKRGGFKFWSIFSEKYGMPWVIGKVPRNATQTERANLLSKLRYAVQDAVAVISEGDTVEFADSGSKSASSDVFRSMIETCNSEISKAVLGQTLTTEMGKTGSYAASQTHENVREDITAGFDQQMIRNEMDKLVSWFYELNFPGSKPCNFVFYEDEDAQIELAGRDKVLSEQGVKFSKAYYMRVYGFNETDLEVTAGIMSLESTTAEPEQEPPPEFAESKPAEDKFRDVDPVVDAGVKIADEQIMLMIKPLMESGSFSEAEKILKTLEMPERFQELLARAMFHAGAIGAGHVQKEIR